MRTRVDNIRSPRRLALPYNAYLTGAQRSGALRGRVSSVNMIFIGASNELGAAESGFLAALTSATFSVVAGGVACLGVLGAISAWVPSLRSYRIGADPVQAGDLH